MAAQVHAKTIMAVNYSVDINIDPEDDSNAIFILQLEKDSWVGLALGAAGMAPGTDIIQIDGANREVYDKVSAGYQYPTTDYINNLTATFTEVNESWLEVEIKRPLDTEDLQDFVIPTNESFEVGWAIRYQSP